MAIVISGALQPLQEEYGLGTMQKEFIVGGTTFAAIFGGLGAGMVRLLSMVISSAAGTDNRSYLQGG